jgi:hypothetical protein
MIFAGTPAATTLSCNDFVTTALAPMVTGDILVLLDRIDKVSIIDVIFQI